MMVSELRRISFISTVSSFWFIILKLGPRSVVFAVSGRNRHSGDAVCDVEV